MIEFLGKCKREQSVGPRLTLPKKKKIAWYISWWNVHSLGFPELESRSFPLHNPWPLNSRMALRYPVAGGKAFDTGIQR